jgi:hypothetical protein
MYYLSIGAIFRDEIYWLHEWMEYHHACGIEHFYLFNNDENPQPAEEILKSYIDKGITEVIRFPGKRQQMAAYRQAIKISIKKSRWLCLIDLDEFLLPRQCDDLREIMAKYEKYSALAVHWNVFGSSGLQKRPENQIDNFLYRTDEKHPLNRHVKTILTPEYCFPEDSINPHYFAFHTGYTVNEKQEPIRSPFGNYTADVIRINHYAVRSYEDFWNVKVPRGQPSVLPRRDINYWKQYDINDVFDDEISQRFGRMPKMKKQVCDNDSDLTSKETQ